jgi:subtilisin family serine protease
LAEGFPATDINSASVELIKIKSLMQITAGSFHLPIGLIDGPIDVNHSALKKSRIVQIIGDGQDSTFSANGAIEHGTFMAGILASHRDYLPSICPKCPIVSYPIFDDKYVDPQTSTGRLSEAIIRIINSGVKIINLSLEIPFPTYRKYPELEDALYHAIKNEVIMYRTEQ